MPVRLYRNSWYLVSCLTVCSKLRELAPAARGGVEREFKHPSKLHLSLGRIVIFPVVKVLLPERILLYTLTANSERF